MFNPSSSHVAAAMAAALSLMPSVLYLFDQLETFEQDQRAAARRPLCACWRSISVSSSANGVRQQMCHGPRYSR